MAYSEGTIEARLAAVRTAIERCLASQSYEIGGQRKQQMAELAQLRQMEKELEQQQANASQASGNGYVAHSFEDFGR